MFRDKNNFNAFYFLNEYFTALLHLIQGCALRICFFLLVAKFFSVIMAEKGSLVGVSERTLALRNQFLQQAHNPYRHMTGEGGHVVSYE